MSEVQGLHVGTSLQERCQRNISVISTCCKARLMVRFHITTLFSSRCPRRRIADALPRSDAICFVISLVF
jgi:hypothetical protein